MCASVYKSANIDHHEQAEREVHEEEEEEEEEEEARKRERERKLNMFTQRSSEIWREKKEQVFCWLLLYEGRGEVATW